MLVMAPAATTPLHGAAAVTTPMAPSSAQGVAFKAQCKSAVALVKERRIEFVRATKAKVVGKVGDAAKHSAVTSRAAATKVLVDEHALPRLLTWKHSKKIGPGFSNLGNTCYLNSVLQCLSYTPCLAQFLLEKEAKLAAQHKPNGGFCPLRVMARLMQTVHAGAPVAGNAHGKHGGNSSGRVVQPRELVMNVRHLSKSFRIGRQEDSHEFFRLLLDSMHRSCLRRAGIKQENHPSAPTTLVHRAFAGQLKNSLKCAKCNFVSERLDDFLDLSLEINNGIKSVRGALKHFTAVEKLDDSNAWKCSSCGQPSRAEKGMTIEQCPNVLVVQLKRFDVMHGKIKKHIEFSTTLDLARGMSKSSEDRKRGRTKYELHGVLVHAGFSTECGHYYAFVKGSSNQWYEMNDECVRWVSIDTVLQQKAYMLFYSRVLPAEELAKLNPKVETPTAPVVPTKTATVEEVPEKVAQPKHKDDLNMNGFLASLKTDLTKHVEENDSKGPEPIPATIPTPARPAKVTSVVTYAFVERSTKPQPRAHKRCLAPSFVGLVGKWRRFQPRTWRSMDGVMLTQQQQDAPVQASTVAANADNSKPKHSETEPAPEAPAVKLTKVQFDPRMLKRHAMPNSALYGHEVNKWAENGANGSTDAVESNGHSADPLAAKHDAILTKLRQEERAHRNAGRQDMWNETLDAGHVRKIKKRKEFVPNEGKTNAFQRALLKKPKK
ncbi:TPA: hypothetical protein N0F65_008802 [Lagenidium giganteum]|uniref:Ubiquitin carboxyl-terminal hydrolase n=1 Tax=Lagenidium giganteum TaxID=4803 RepID=A0AAV2YZI2_9STRA|nr:TPA: hypothetical protein N0F65_008802 [Lagenidium giganteum]